MMDPFYPCTLSFPHQETDEDVTGGSSSNVEKIPYQGGVYWRVFLHSEVGLEHCLQSLPEKFNAKKLLQRYIRGADCSKGGGDQWEAAEESFLECKNMLLEVEAIGNDNLELGQTRDFLLAWALLPLAELYQSQGNADMLKKAMDVRKEILDLIVPLQSSHALLVRVCRSYYYTAWYEWGKSMESVEAQGQATREFAELFRCSLEEAEYQICLLLAVDHGFFWSFAVSLRWCERANDIPEPSDWYPMYFNSNIIEYQMRLLMKLKMFPAVETVANQLSPSFFRRKRSMSSMLYECFTAIGESADSIWEFQKILRYKEIADAEAREIRRILILDFTKDVVEDQEEHRKLHIHLLNRYENLARTYAESTDGYSQRQAIHFQILATEQRDLQSCTSCDEKMVRFTLWGTNHQVPASLLIEEPRTSFLIGGSLGLLPEGFGVGGHFDNDIGSSDSKFQPLSTILTAEMILSYRKNVLLRLYNQKSLFSLNKYEKEGGSEEQFVSATGCYADSEKDYLVQSQAGLKFHLQKLPLPLHLAFQKHGDLGCSHLEHREWDDAILEFECCIEVLNLIKGLTLELETADEHRSVPHPQIIMACDWLMVWAHTPLADIYQFGKRNFLKAYGLRRKMNRMIPSGDSKELRLVRECVSKLVLAGIYEYYDTENRPNDTKKVVDLFSKLTKHWEYEDKAKCEEARTSYEELHDEVGRAYTKYDYEFLAQLYYLMSIGTIRFSSFNSNQIKSFIRQDANFKHALQYLHKWKQGFPESTETSMLINLQLAKLYNAVDIKYEEYLDSLTSLPSESVDSNVASSLGINLYHQEIETYLEMESEIKVQKYGELAAIPFVNKLENTSLKDRQNIDGWTKYLEKAKSLFPILQDHYLRKAKCYNALNKDDEYQETIETAFLYAEGECTRCMANNYGFDNFSYKEARWGLDAKKLGASEAFREDCDHLLKGGSVFVEYSHVKGDEYMVYVVNQSGIIAAEKTLVSRKEFEPMAERLRHGFERPILYYDDDNAADGCRMDMILEFMYEKLIQPIERYLHTMMPNHKLILSPCQLFAQVPFAALQDKQRENKCLIECHTISMTTSLSVVKFCSDRLLELQRRSDPLVSGSKIIALADPKYDACEDCQAYIGTLPGSLQWRHTSLPGTRKEVEEIVEVFGEENSQKVVTLLQEQATAQILLKTLRARTSGDPSFGQAIIHIGAHGNSNERYRWKSAALSLACPCDSVPQSAIIAGFSSMSTDDDGRAVTSNVTEEYDMKIYSTHDLKFKDICRSEPRWSAELVVLSACETSRGRLYMLGRRYMLESCCSTPERPREGVVMSLVRSLHIAGVPCVVASLWSICDKATPPLMKKFYEELREGNDVATALQSAMLHRMILIRRERTRHNWLIALNNMLLNLPARKCKWVLKWRVAAHSIMRHEVRERLRRRVWAPFNVWGEFSLQIPEDLRKMKPNAS